ncbi:MAG: HDIG domain-containing protein [Muribaculaceae bacterium]|nr:HDIG domain-containing protein [Muribaculaceae bacterium]
MDPYLIIDKYYREGQLRDLLILHSRKVADKALSAIRNTGLTFNRDLLYSGAMLHDIGIKACHAPDIFCMGDQPYICHGIIGGEILRKEGYPDLARFCERHTGAGLTIQDIKMQNLPLPLHNYLPETIEEKAVCYADKFFSKSGNPAEEKSFERVKASMARHGSDTLKRFLDLHLLFSQK